MDGILGFFLVPFKARSALRVIVILWRHPHTSAPSPHGADNRVIPRTRQDSQRLRMTEGLLIVARLHFNQPHRLEGDGLPA